MVWLTSTGEEIAPYVTETTPENQAATLRNQDQVWAVRAIRRGEVVRPLPTHKVSLADLTYDLGGARFKVDDFMARRRTAGLLILKNGETALERYGLAMARRAFGPASRPPNR